MQSRRDVFQAIADPTRREIIQLIASQSLNLNAIADNFSVSRPAISQHIKILVECGLIVIQKQGRERYCEAKLQKLDEVSAWIERYRKIWADQFDALDDLLDQMKAKPKRQNPKKTKGRRS
jgi:DNA-binding transcriptional ArsR family regulator